MDQRFDDERHYPPYVHDAWAETLAQQRERLAQAGRVGYGSDAYSYPGMDESPPQQSMGDSSDSWQHWSPQAQYAPQQEFSGVGGDYDPHVHGDRRSKIIDHDHPPTWDGEKPEDHVRTYLRWLNLWLRTTKTQESQRGMIIWQATKGKLRSLFEANFEDDDKLVSEEAPAEMIKLVKATFHEYLEDKVADVFEK